MTYSLLDDSDWQEYERRRREAESLGSLLDDAPSGIAPLPQGAPPSFGPMELAPLAEDSTAPDWTTGVSIGASALAALADIALNKGRGTGQILAAGAAGADRSADIRLRGRQEAMQYEQARARQAMEERQLAERAKYNQYLYDNMGVRSGNQAALDADRDANRLLRERSLSQNDTRIAQADTRIQQGDRRLDQVEDLGLAEGKSAAQARGRIGTELDYADQTGDAAADRARKVQSATQEGAIERIRAGTEARYEAEAPERAGRHAREYAKDSQEFRSIGEPAEAVLAQLDQYRGKDAPGVGMLDSRVPDMLLGEEGLRLRQNARRAGEMVLRSNTGAAAPLSEKQLNDLATGINAGATESQLRISMELVRDFARNNARALAVGREASAGKVLEASGLPQWAPQQEEPLPPDTNTGPVTGISYPSGTGTGGHDRLPVTNQKRSQVPRVDEYLQGAGGGGGGVPIARPMADGSFDVDGETYTAAEVQILRAKGVIR